MKIERSDWSLGGPRLSGLMCRVCLRMNASMCVSVSVCAYAYAYASEAAGLWMRERAVIQRQAPPLQHHTLPLPLASNL